MLVSDFLRSLNSDHFKVPSTMLAWGFVGNPACNKKSYAMLMTLLRS